MKLFCIRHGQASSIEVDPRCSLTRQGQREVNVLADYLLQNGAKISHIFHSGKPRAQQTASILSQVLQIECVTESPSLLDCTADIEDLLNYLPSWHENTLLVGHLPFIPRLVNALVLGVEHADKSPIIHCPPAAMVCLERQQNQRWIIRSVLSPNPFGMGS